MAFHEKVNSFPYEVGRPTKKLEVSIFKTNYFGLNGVFDQFIKDAIAKIPKRAIW